MKSKRLDLNDLKVKSFITNLDGQEEETVKGGNHVTCPLCVSINEEGCTIRACFSQGEHCSIGQIC